jgi:uncharacterized protein YcgI (DUF1989 family)
MGYAWCSAIYWAFLAVKRYLHGVGQGLLGLNDPSISAPQVIAARGGRALRMARGETVRIINLHGSQVVDTWAFCADDPAEFMSMEHSRTHWLRANPAVGDSLLTNLRRPIATLVADTSPGVHDTLIAACDKARYVQLSGDAGHANCADNLRVSLGQSGIFASVIPAPLNLFMNVAILDGGRLEFRAPVCNPGDYVELRAERDLIMVFSACPQDILPVNGLHPRDVAIMVMT